ncbi:SPP41 family protein [Kocuria palustris]|nr:SPP41 family protein [Kocuria palustris]
MDSEEGGTSKANLPRPSISSDPFAAYHHRKPLISTDLDQFSLDAAIGDAFKAVLGTTTEEPAEEASDNDGEFNFDDTISQAFKKVMAEAKQESNEPEIGEPYKNDQLPAEHYPDQHNSHAIDSNNHHDSADASFDLEGAIDAAFELIPTNGAAADERDGSVTPGSHHDNGIDMRAEIKDVFEEMESLSYPQKDSENASDKLDLEGVISGAFEGLAKSAEPEIAHLTRHSPQETESAGLTAEARNDEVVDHELPNENDDVDDEFASAIGEAFKAFPELGVSVGKSASPDQEVPAQKDSSSVNSIQQIGSNEPYSLRMTLRSTTPHLPATLPKTRSALPPVMDNNIDEVVATKIESHASSREISQAPSGLSSPKAEVERGEPSDDDDLNAVISNALDSVLGVGAKESLAPTQSELEPVHQIESESRQEAIPPQRSQSHLPEPRERKDLIDLSQVIGNAVKVAISGLESPSAEHETEPTGPNNNGSTDTDLEAAIGDALLMFTSEQVKENDDDDEDLDDAIGQAFQTVLGANLTNKVNDRERSKADADADLEQAISDALSIAAPLRGTQEGNEELEHIISEAFTLVLEDRRPRRDLILHVASVMRQSLDTEIEASLMDSIIENAFSMAMARLTTTPAPELSRLVLNLSAKYGPSKRGAPEKQAREREFTLTSLKVARHYVEGLELEGSAILLSNLLNDHTPGAANDHEVPWVNPSYISTIATQVISALSIECRCTSDGLNSTTSPSTDASLSPSVKLRADSRERKKQWRLENVERNLDIELKLRVTRRAITLYGEEDNADRRKWIEEEFNRRRDRRYARNKRARGHDKEMVESLTRNPHLASPVTSLFTLSSALFNNVSVESVSACVLATATAGALYAHEHEVVDIKLILVAVFNILMESMERQPLQERLLNLRTGLTGLSAPYFPGDSPPSPEEDDPHVSVFFDIAKQIQGLADNVLRKRPRVLDSLGSKRAKYDGHYPTLALPATLPFILNKLNQPSSGGSTPQPTPPKPYGGLRKPGSFQRPQPKMKRQFSSMYQ